MKTDNNPKPNLRPKNYFDIWSNWIIRSNRYLDEYDEGGLAPDQLFRRAVTLQFHTVNDFKVVNQYMKYSSRLL